jgi:transcriptional regulator GlxA family with amidase domain
LDRAKWLLLDTDLSVTDVCMEVGFSSLGSLSYTFTQRTGLSPSRYKEWVRRFAREGGEAPPELIPGCLSLMAQIK